MVRILNRRLRINNLRVKYLGSKSNTKEVRNMGMTPKLALHLAKLHEKQKKGTYHFSETARKERYDKQQESINKIAETFLDKTPLGMLFAVKELQDDDD